MKRWEGPPTKHSCGFRRANDYDLTSEPKRLISTIILHVQSGTRILLVWSRCFARQSHFEQPPWRIGRAPSPNSTCARTPPCRQPPYGAASWLNERNDTYLLDFTSHELHLHQHNRCSVSFSMIYQSHSIFVIVHYSFDRAS